MSSPANLHTITYRQPGTVPPVYLAVSAGDPQWQPREMQYSRDSDGEYVFTSKVGVVPGEQYRYKFRIGQGDRWTVDSKRPVVTDAVQGKANVLSVPPRGTAEPPQSSSEERLQNNNRRPAHVDSPSSAQTRDAAATAAEVADTARSLDNYGLDDSRNDGARADYARKDHDPRTCLFSHEDLGAYDFEDDDGSGNDSHDAPEPLSRSKTASSYETDDIDVNDPTIESFPCDRTSVMNTLRTIQSSLGEDHVQRADQGASSSSRPTGRRSNNDSAVDSNESAASPTYPTHSRPRDSRSSSGSILGKDKSAAPLGSIAE